MLVGLVILIIVVIALVFLRSRDRRLRIEDMDSQYNLKDIESSYGDIPTKIRRREDDSQE